MTRRLPPPQRARKPQRETATRPMIGRVADDSLELRHPADMEPSHSIHASLCAILCLDIRHHQACQWRPLTCAVDLSILLSRDRTPWQTTHHKCQGGLRLPLPQPAAPLGLPTSLWHFPSMIRISNRSRSPHRGFESPAGFVGLWNLRLRGSLRTDQAPRNSRTLR